jgi:hypothetical protein
MKQSERGEQVQEAMLAKWLASTLSDGLYELLG